MLETRVAEVPDDRRTRGSLGIVYAALGRRDDAVREGELALELLGEDRGENLGYQIKGLAQIYVLLGEYDRAIEQLERLLSTPTFFAGPLLGAEPTWEPLRAEPRFQALIGSV